MKWRDALRLSGAGRDDRRVRSLDRDTPYGFAIVVGVGDRVHAERAVEHTRSGVVAVETTVDPTGDPARVRLRITSDLDHAALALRRVLWAMRKVGVEVVRYEWDDLVRDVSDRQLEAVIDDWNELGNRGPARRRVEALAGRAVLARLLAWAADPARDRSWRWSAAFGVANVVGNEPIGPLADLVLARAADLAARNEPDDAGVAGRLLDGVRSVMELRGFGLDVRVSERVVTDLVTHPAWQVHGAALEIVAQLPPPLDDDTTTRLLALATEASASKKSKEIWAAQVASALGACPDRADVREALRRFLAHPGGDVRATAAFALARSGGRDEVAAVWEQWLASRSPSDRLHAEDLVAAHGDERDVTLVASVLDRRLRPVKGTTYSPPRAAPLIDFLVKHRDDREAEAALERVRSRFGRLDADVQAWVVEHHPELVPAPPG